MQEITLLFALFPFIFFLGLMFLKRVSLVQISMVALVVTLGIQLFFWKIIPVYLLNSAIKGFFVAFDIFLIVFGAVFFLEVLKKVKVIENIGRYLESISKDYRVQVILLAWFLLNFLEGMAGFGTPGAIVAPLLVSIGLSPITSVIVSLLGNSSAGTFGAVGTPIRVGFAGLNVTGVPMYAALFNGVGILMPLFMVWAMVKGRNEAKKSFLEMIPFAIWSGFLFWISSFVVVSIGQEFVSVIGSLLAIVLVIISVKLGLFLPKNIRTLKENNDENMSLPFYKVILPYLVVFVLLVMGKYFLKPLAIHFAWGYTYDMNLFNPGVMFLAAGVPFALLWGERGLCLDSLKMAIKRTRDPFLVILSMSTMIQVMVSSGNNISGLPSVLSVLAKDLSGKIIPLVTPFVGAFGAFLTGSITVSNILFGNILQQASVVYGLSSAKVLALEISSAAVGNSMAIADIMSAEAVLGLKNKTREVLRGTVGPCLLLLTVLAVFGVIFI